MRRILIGHGFKEVFLNRVSSLGFTQHWSIVKQECEDGSASLVETKN